MKYYTGFFIEKALSIDNVFVISLIFTYFAIPRMYQYRALLWGIIAVIVLRGIMIGSARRWCSNGIGCSTSSPPSWSHRHQDAVRRRQADGRREQIRWCASSRRHMRVTPRSCTPSTSS
jgi:hypothetical protein